MSTPERVRVTFLFRHREQVLLPEGRGVGTILHQRVQRRTLLGEVVDYAVRDAAGVITWEYEADLVPEEETP